MNEASAVIRQIFASVAEFLRMTVQTDAIWIVIPLLISTLLMIIYFGIYRGEKTDWNTHLSNSFVLVFVSLALFRYIYLINNTGAFNFVEHWGKTLLTVFLLTIGIFLVKFNFEHLLPMKFARYINSPLTVNLFTYAVILLVYSKEKLTWIPFFGILIISFVIVGALLLTKFLSTKFGKYFKREKERERIRNVKEAVFEIKELKQELKEREKELEEIKMKEADNEKKEAIKVKKILRNSLKK